VNSPFLLTPSDDSARVSTGLTPSLAQFGVSDDSANRMVATAGLPQDVIMEGYPTVLGAEKTQNEDDQVSNSILPSPTRILITVSTSR
jgi:hypothetical protein